MTRYYFFQSANERKCFYVFASLTLIPCWGHCTWHTVSMTAMHRRFIYTLDADGRLINILEQQQNS